MKTLPCTITTLALLTGAFAPLHSYAADETNSTDPAAEKTLAPYFQVLGPDGGAVESLPLKATDVKATVSGSIADVVVTQTYTNRGKVPIEALYVFPGSTRAAVHGMEMRIGERIIKAQIKEKQEAQAAYEKAKSENKTASLLEQKRPNVFQMKVANILPGDEVRTILHYTETLDARDAQYEFVFPTVLGPRFSMTPADSPQGKEDAWVENPYLAPEKSEPGSDLVAEPQTPVFTLRVDIRAGMPIKSLRCVSHEAEVKYHGPDSASLVLANSESRGANRDFVLRFAVREENVAAGMLLHRGADENFFCVTVQPPAAMKAEMMPPREYVFVLDVSGSMNGFPLDTAKSLMRGLLGGLRAEDTFNVVLFAGGSNVLSNTSDPATPERIAEAQRFVDAAGGSGSTQLLAALRKAFSLPGDEARSRTLAIITDGYVDIERQSYDLVRKNLGRGNVFAFGIGSSVNRYLIEGLARTGRGETFFALNAEEAEKEAVAFRRYIEAPALTDVKVTFDGFTVSAVEPAAVPDVFARRPIEVFGKWSGEAQGKVRITGRTGHGEWSHEFDVAAAAKAGVSNPALRALWARERVRQLADYKAVDPTDHDAKNQIIQLGLKYELLTEFTSFVAVDESPRELLAAARTVIQPLPLPRGVSPLAVGGSGGAAGTTPEPGGVLLVLIASAALLCVRNRRQDAAK